MANHKEKFPPEDPKKEKKILEALISGDAKALEEAGGKIVKKPEDLKHDEEMRRFLAARRGPYLPPISEEARPKEAQGEESPPPPPSFEVSLPAEGDELGVGAVDAERIAELTKGLKPPKRGGGTHRVQKSQMGTRPEVAGLASEISERHEISSAAKQEIDAMDNYLKVKPVDEWENPYAEKLDARRTLVKAAIWNKAQASIGNEDKEGQDRFQSRIVWLKEEMQQIYDEWAARRKSKILAEAAKESAAIEGFLEVTPTDEWEKPYAKDLDELRKSLQDAIREQAQALANKEDEDIQLHFKEKIASKKREMQKVYDKWQAKREQEDAGLGDL